MRLIRSMLPHIALSLDITLLIVLYLDRRNPMMGFLVGAPFAVLCCAACILSAVCCILYWLEEQSRKS